jgi:phosphomevalonate kinase
MYFFLALVVLFYHNLIFLKNLKISHFTFHKRRRRKKRKKVSAKMQSFDSVSSTNAVIQVSAPGKVLISGGYLVLDQSQIGAILSVSARIRCKAKLLDQQEQSIVVFAPQRLDTPAIIELDNSLGKLIRQEGSNVFVTKSVQYAAMLAMQLKNGLGKIQPFALEIIGDQEFYTSSKGKTGLGSSACLVSVIVTAILKLFEVEFDDEKEFLRAAHNLAQFVHCAAQGKVGSGFDVSSAFFGTQKYSRFSEEILKELLDLDAKGAVEGEFLKRAVTKIWDVKVEKFNLPPFIELVLGDVQSGSETPGMVRKVLQWKENGAPESIEFWNELGKKNEVFISCLQKLQSLHDISPPDYEKALDFAIKNHPSTWVSYEQPIIQLLGQTRAIFCKIRESLKSMGEQSGADIEPDSQTSLLDSCMNDIPGVICAGVPGAGGNDAIFCLVLNRNSSLQKLKEIWSSKSLVHELDIHEDSSGIRCVKS